jgi:hypothetical protein
MNINNQQLEDQILIFTSTISNTTCVQITLLTCSLGSTGLSNQPISFDALSAPLVRCSLWEERKRENTKMNGNILNLPISGHFSCFESLRDIVESMHYVQDQYRMMISMTREKESVDVNSQQNDECDLSCPRKKIGLNFFFFPLKIELAWGSISSYQSAFKRLVLNRVLTSAIEN